MKLKKEYIALFGIIAILLLYLIFSSNKEKISYEIPELKKIEKGEINKLEIIKKDQTITLEGKDEKWRIMPQEYPADYDRVKDMLEVVEDLTLTELAAEKKDYERYDLNDEKKIHVKAYKAGKVLREFDIGKTSSTYSHTFIRIEQDSRVYHAQESFRTTFERDIGELRDKKAMTFDKEEISKIVVAQKEETIEFVKKIKPLPASTEEDKDKQKPQQPQEKTIWELPDGKEANTEEVDSLIGELSDLECDEYIEGQDKQDLKDPVYSVTLQGAKQYILQIFNKEDKEDGKYPALSSENSYPFLLSTWKAERIMKKPEDLKNAKKPENQDIE